jgi:hypothetical protein
MPSPKDKILLFVGWVGVPQPNLQENGEGIINLRMGVTNPVFRKNPGFSYEK